MTIEPYEITTVYPDGRTETRISTPEETAQREADIIEGERIRAEREAWIAEQEANKASAKAKLAALGLTEEEVRSITGI